MRFNDTAATAVTISTDGTLLIATYPALAAGNYTIHLDATNHTGEIPSNVALRVLDPVAFAATTLDYPASTTDVRSLIYDAERQALLAVTDTAPSNPIVRYQYANGAWGAPTQAANGFLDAALSADGTQLFGNHRHHGRAGRSGDARAGHGRHRAVAGHQFGAEEHRGGLRQSRR